MSDVFQMLGRGLVTDFRAFFADELPDPSPETNIDQLIAQLATDSDSAQLHLQIGMLYMDRGSSQLAADHFSKALALQPDSRQAHFALVFAHIQLGNDDQAIAQLHSSIEAHGTDPKLCFALAFCHERAGDVNAAVGFYQQVLQLDQKHAPAHYRLAAIELRQGKFSQAIEHYQALHTDDPGSVFVLMSLGALYLLTDQPDLAQETFQRALLIEPDNWQAADEQADTLEEAQLYDEAIQHVAEQIAAQPEFADLHLRIAGLYAKAGLDQLAVQHFHKALQIHPSFLEAMVRLGAHHLRMNRFLDSAKCFAHAVQINDNLLLAYVGLGLSQSQLAQAEQAEQSFSMAASIEPNTILLFAEMARLQLKHVLASRGLDPSGGLEEPENFLLDQQIAAHARYLASHPNCADLHYRYGLLLSARSRLDQAIEHFRRALTINPAYPQAVLNLALALRQQSCISDSSKLLSRCFHADPQSLELYYRLGLMYSNQATFALTIEHFASSLGDSSPTVDLQPNISLALQNMYLIDPAAASFNITSQITATIPESLPVPG